MAGGSVEVMGMGYFGCIVLDCIIWRPSGSGSNIDSDLMAIRASNFLYLYHLLEDRTRAQYPW